MTEAGNGSSGAEAIPAATPAPAPTPSQVQPNYSSRWTSPAHSAPLTCVAWSPSGRLLAAGSADACLRLYRLSDSRSASAASGVDATAPVAAAASVSPDADDVPSLTLVCEVPAAHEKGINDVVFTHDEQHLVTASDDRMLIIWNIVAAESSAGGGGGEIALQPARTCVGHTSYVFCCAVNRAGNLLVSGSYDESVRVWDVRSAKCLLTIAAHSDPVSSVDFSRDGTMVASASYDGLVRVWERASGRCLKTLCAARAPPASLVRFSPNGRFLLAATLDNTLRLWDYSQKDRVVKEYVGHANTRFCLSASFTTLHPPGQHIVCGSEDGRLVLWDVRVGEAVASATAPEGSSEPILALAPHPTRQIIATAAMDKPYAIHLWTHRDK